MTYSTEGIEEREQAFVLAVACDEPLWWGGPQYRRADHIAQEASDWQRLSGGSGAKGERLYDWALLPVWRLQLTPQERHWGDTTCWCGAA